MTIQLLTDPEANTKLKIFLRHYLNIRSRLDEPHCVAWHRMCERANELDWQVVAKLIRARVIGPEDPANPQPGSGPPAWRDRGGYSQYRRTIYWKLVAQAVKQRDDYLCAKCGRFTRHCEAHHLDYDCLGSEHSHLHRLQTLCPICHDLEHGDLISAVIHEYELTPTNPMTRLDHLFDDIYVPTKDDDDAEEQASGAATRQKKQQAGLAVEFAEERARERRRRGTEDRPGDHR